MRAASFISFSRRAMVALRSLSVSLRERLAVSSPYWATVISSRTDLCTVLGTMPCS